MPGPDEAKTRKELIDPAFERAGWDMRNPDQIGIEIPVDGFDPATWKTLEAKLRRLGDAGAPYDAELPKGICDYTLYHPNGESIAVVEAKRTSVDPPLGRGAGRVLRHRTREAAVFPALCLHDQRPRNPFWGRGARAQQREAERQAEQLFQTLLHRAFRGKV